MVAIKDMGFPNCCANCNLVELDEIDNFYCGYTHHYCDNQNDKRNSDCPLVEIEERKVGKWKESLSPSGSGLIGYKCSSCGKFYPLIEGLNYCPNCGSLMSKEV